MVSMKKKRIVILVSVLAIAACLGIVLTNFMRTTNVTDQQIREMFECDRITTDVLSTDIYCSNPDLYRDDLNNNRVVKGR
jgi:Flp pilus assembly protein CpaB